MKIRKLHLQNIGVFDDETIEFKPCLVKDKAEIHILTGQNGSGKSTILMALAGLFIKWKTVDFDNQRNNYFKKRFRYFDYDGGESFIYQDEDKFRSQIKAVSDENELVKIFANPTWFNSIISNTNSNLIDDYSNWLLSKSTPENELKFAVFAYSGYRHIQSEPVEANKQPRYFNPLSQSLEFIKDYSKENEITINQLIVNNISNWALAKDEEDIKEAKKYEKVISGIEDFIRDVVGFEVKFVYKREPRELKINIRGEELDFDVLPDGLRSLISWIADLLSRVDLLRWQDDLPITEKNLILLLDEVEVHLHPKWQRKVLPVVQKLFKNSQIFVSTHSPFVINSIDDAWVYKLKLENGKARVTDVVKSEDGISYQTVLSEILDIDEEFGGKTQDDLDKFYSIVRNGKKINEKELKKLAKSLAEQSDELNSIVQIELRQLSRRKGKELSI
jgi:predicted ATP-binding protein involved in virulence